MEPGVGIVQQRQTFSSEGGSLNRVMEIMPMQSEEATAKESMQQHLPVEGQEHSNEQCLEEKNGLKSNGEVMVRLHTPAFQTSVENRGSAGVPPSLNPDS